MKLGNNVVVQVGVVVLTLILAWVIPTSLFVLFDNKDIFGDNLNSGAEAHGATNLVQTSGEAIEGLPSTTIQFNANETGYATASTTLNFMANSVATNRNLEIVNMLATGTTTTGKTFDIKFYGASRNDYMDGGEFKTVTQILTRALGNKIVNISIVSKPTSEGKRVVEVIVSGPEVTDNSGANMKRTWADIMASIDDVYEFDGTIFKVSVKAGKEVNNYVTANFYDADTYTTSLNIPEPVWPIVATGLTSPIANGLPAKQIIYDGQFTVNNSVLRIILDETTMGEDAAPHITKFIANMKTVGLVDTPFAVSLNKTDVNNVLHVAYSN